MSKCAISFWQDQSSKYAVVVSVVQNLATVQCTKQVNIVNLRALRLATLNRRQDTFEHS